MSREEKIEKQAYRINEFSEAFGISKSAIYQEINKGRLDTFKFNSVTLITKDAAADWVKLCKADPKRIVHTPRRDR